MILLERNSHSISSSTVKIHVFKINSVWFFFFAFGKVEGKKVDTMISNKTIMSQCRFTALEDPNASPVSVTL